MQQISTNLTLLLKIFIPTFWLALFGTFTVAVWVTGYEYFGPYPGDWVRYGLLAFYLIGAALLYFTVIRLKRVEFGEDQFYVTNYFQHFRYAYTNIARIREMDLGLFRVMTIVLKKPGSFGKNLTFIPSMRRLQEFLDSHPDLTRLFLELEKKN